METLVVLTEDERERATFVGSMRRQAAVKRGRRWKAGEPEAPKLLLDIEGAMAELAVAKHYGVTWTGALGNTRMADVGDVDVRLSRYPQGDLLLYPDEPARFPLRAFLLVTGEHGRYTLRGWCLGREAWAWGRMRVISPRRPAALAVPQSRLWPPAELPPELLRQRGVYHAAR